MIFKTKTEFGFRIYINGQPLIERYFGGNYIYPHSHIKGNVKSTKLGVADWDEYDVCILKRNRLIK